MGHRPSRERAIPAGEFKARCLELMEEVRERRTEYVITKRGKPVAKLTPCDDTPSDAFGVLKGAVTSHDDIVAPDPEAWGEES
jgi:prevent-host-death family protein